MTRNHLMAMLIGGGAIVAVVLVLVLGNRPAREPLDSPEVLTDRVLTAETTAEKARAAESLVRHGPKARVEIRRALTSVHNELRQPGPPAAAGNPSSTGPTSTTSPSRSLPAASVARPEVVVPLLRATAKSRDWRSLPMLFDLMDHSDLRIRGKAGAAAQKIMGADYMWRANDEPAKRARALRLMREQYERMLPEFESFYSDQTR